MWWWDPSPSPTWNTSLLSLCTWITLALPANSAQPPFLASTPAWAEHPQARTVCMFLVVVFILILSTVLGPVDFLSNCKSPTCTIWNNWENMEEHKGVRQEGNCWRFHFPSITIFDIQFLLSSLYVCTEHMSISLHVHICKLVIHTQCCICKYIGAQMLAFYYRKLCDT
jgi:hypothetical protein